MQVTDIYYGFLRLITNYIYNGNLVSGSYEEMCAVMVATFCSFLLIALPFVGVYCAIRALLKVWRF